MAKQFQSRSISPTHRSLAMVSCRVALVLLVTASSITAVRSDDEEAGPEYGYMAGSKAGPESWAKLSPKYKLCGEGKRQSPIDIVTKQAISSPNLDTLTRTYAAATATLVNNGKGISMVFDSKVGTVTIDGKVYGLKKVTWHSPSEHTINGERFALELHLVHKSDDGKTAIIAILYKLGAPDSFYFQLKSKLAELAKDKCNYGEEEARVAAEVVHLRSLQKRTGSYFRYTGSLTVPPCTENVIWAVLGKVRQISKEQVNLLAAPLPAGKNNARPVQPYNDRGVAFYNPPNSTISFDI